MNKAIVRSVFAALISGALLLSPGWSVARDFQAQSTQFTPTSPGVQSAAIPQFPSAVPSTNIVRPDYIIAPDDVISVDVFDVPDLSRTVQVDAEGRILLPLVGEVPAAGLTVGQLSRKVEQAYGATYVRDPKVMVSVKDAASQKVTVDGAVLQPGIYPISTRTTLMQAIALAKGPDPKLASDKVAIFRTVGQQRTEAVFDLGDIRDGRSVDPQVQPNDIVVVDTSGVRKFLQDISPVAPFAALGAIF